MKWSEKNEISLQWSETPTGPWGHSDSSWSQCTGPWMGGWQIQEPGQACPESRALLPPPQTTKSCSFPCSPKLLLQICFWGEHRFWNEIKIHTCTETPVPWPVARERSATCSPPAKVALFSSVKKVAAFAMGWEEITYNRLSRGLANFFCKGWGNKYFRLCRRSKIKDII